MEKANSACFEGEYEDALTLYKKVLASEEDNVKPLAYARIAFCQEKLGNYKDATVPDGWLRKGTSAFHIGEVEASREALSTWIGLCHDHDWSKAPTSTQSIWAKVQPPPTPTTTPTTTSAPVQTLPRNSWYQDDTTVTIDVYQKKLNPDQVDVTISTDSVRCTVKDQWTHTWNTAHPIDPTHSRFRVCMPKIEIVLTKATPEPWKTLSREEAPMVSKVQPKLFDAELADFEKEEEEAKQKAGGDAALQTLFQSIYANASDEQRRAMDKSFQESGGTVLSTNWEDVGKKKVECQPPEGLQAKSWHDK